MQIETADVSLIGHREENQDRVAVAAADQAVLLVVIDGMGGHAEGARAAETALATLLESARKTRWRIWATSAPFASRETLKTRGYRWNNGCDGRPKSWHIDVDEEALEAEREFLRREIYRRDVEIAACPITAFDRFSVRS